MSECICGNKLMDHDPSNPYIVAQDMFDFINTKEDWEIFTSPSICLGMLMSVYSVVHHLAPNEETATKTILDALEMYKREDFF
jgi:hypothetical protein